MGPTDFWRKIIEGKDQKQLDIINGYFPVDDYSVQMAQLVAQIKVGNVRKGKANKTLDEWLAIVKEILAQKRWQGLLNRKKEFDPNNAPVPKVYAPSVFTLAKKIRELDKATKKKEISRKEAKVVYQDYKQQLEPFIEEIDDLNEHQQKFLNWAMQTGMRRIKDFLYPDDAGDVFDDKEDAKHPEVDSSIDDVDL